MARPQKYTDNYLKERIIEIKVQYNYQKVTPTILHKETGIERTVWIKRMKEFLDEINEPTALVEKFDSSFTSLPNLGEVVMENIDNKKELLDALSTYTLLMQRFWHKASMCENAEKRIEELETELHEANKANERLKKENEHYQKKFQDALASSTNATQRTEQGLKNVFDIKTAKAKKFMDAVSKTGAFDDD